jgi:RNA-directed DNA polymerase
MIGSSESIEISLDSIWKSWFAFRKGKRATEELHAFQYYLEENLMQLFLELNSAMYRHGGYQHFVVNDNKRRKISVATIRDRVVHRLVYDHLNAIYDKTFIFDVWSCRKGKGLLGAIERTQELLHGYSNSYIWKCDVQKFFDSIDHQTLLNILALRVQGTKTLHMLQTILASSVTLDGKRVGVPIGNLTSQIFANIYLNEFDRFVKHILKPQAYLRYGDDFILIEADKQKLIAFRTASITFLKEKLHLTMNAKSDRMMKAKHGLRFLGMVIWPFGSKLNNRNLRRIYERVNHSNLSSYYGLLKQHASLKKRKRFTWYLQDKLSREI